MNKNLNPKKIRGLALDLDGTTLMPNAILGDRTRDCIRELISRGMQIIIATGRATESSERFRSAMGAEGPMVYFNGAEVVDVPSFKILYANMITIEMADFATDISRSLGIHYQIYLPSGISPETGKYDPEQKSEALLVDSFGPEADMYYKHTSIVPVVTDMKKINTMPDLKGCIKGMFISDPSFHDEIRRRMYDRFGDKINVIRSYPTFIEVVNAGVSKGEALKIAMQHRGLKPDEVIAFGDEENDLPMISAVEFFAAPESARDKIRESADIIYGSNVNEGLAEYLEKTFL